MNYVWMISSIFICLPLGLNACTSSTNATPQVDFEFLPSNKDQVSKTVFADLQSRLGLSNSFIFDPMSDEFTCVAELVDRQILADVQKLLDDPIDQSSNRTFLTVIGRRNYTFAVVSIIRPDLLGSNYESLVGLEYQIKDGCESILSVRRDDY